MKQALRRQWGMLFYFLLMGSLVLVSCSPIEEERSDWPDDGLYTMQWDAYHGFFAEEEVTLQLPLVHVHNQDKRSPVEPGSQWFLTGAGDNLSVTAHQVLPAVGEHPRFSVDTINLRLPQLPVGTHEFSGLKVVDAKGERNYDIGTWRLEIRPAADRRDLTIERRMSQLSEFLWLHAEIRNPTASSLCVQELEFQLHDTYTASLETGPSLDQGPFQSGTPCLNQGEMKAFNFSFAPPAGRPLPQFVSLRPFLTYSQAETTYRSTIGTTFYFYPSTNEQTVLGWLNDGLAVSHKNPPSPQ